MKLFAVAVFLFSLRSALTRSTPVKSIPSCAAGWNLKANVPDNKVTDFDNTTIWKNENLPAEGYVFFYLYTKENTEGQILLINDTESLKNSFFNPSRPTKLITHGYFNSKDSSMCRTLSNAFLSSGDFNVIVIDWWHMQKLPGVSLPTLYSVVVNYVKDVGIYVAKMINFLEDQGMSPTSTTLIGHSLGAHIMGIAGFNAKIKVNYIVGLDPALPKFESKDPGERLSIEDANVVEVIHTNAGDCGLFEQIGHFDFYPNGGSKQPGCVLNQCSHSRAYELYAESITSEKGFFGHKCVDLDAVRNGSCDGVTLNMGGKKKKRRAAKGIYYVKTNDGSPFAL